MSNCIFGLFLILWLGVLTKVKFRMQLYATIVLVSFMIAFSLKAIADAVRLFKTSSHIYDIFSFLTWTSDKIKNLAIIHLIFIVSEVHTKMASSGAEDAKQRTQKLSRVKKLTYIIYLLLIAFELVVRSLHLLMFRKDAQTLVILASLELAFKVAFFVFDVYFIIAMVLPSMNYFRDLKASSTESGQLTSYQRAVVALFYALIVLHLLSDLLNMVYPISVLVDGEFYGID